MKKTVLTFGLISGAVSSLMMLLTVPFLDRIGFDRGEVIGYTTIVASFLLVFFGIRSYRDNVAGGSLTFGRAVIVGILITLVSSACYVATWQVIYYKFAPNFLDKYAAYTVDRLRASACQPAGDRRFDAEDAVPQGAVCQPAGERGVHVPGTVPDWPWCDAGFGRRPEEKEQHRAFGVRTQSAVVPSQAGSLAVTPYMARLRKCHRANQRSAAAGGNPFSRSRAISLVGALPKKRAYSLLNCDGLR